MKVAHIINPVNVPISSDLNQAQPVTFRTMLKAKSDSEFKNQINQYLIGYKEDLKVFPSDFIILPNLEKSVLDTNTFTKQRKLPLISDILYSLKEIDVDYIIYTNVDIALMPFFYDYVFSKINGGSDSLIINRRVVEQLKEDSLMFSEIGKSHPGYDCFVFKKELLNKFILGDTCIGANFIGRVMYSNLVTYSNKLEIVKDIHLTFHIGDDGAWLKNDFSEFDVHNKREALKVVNMLMSRNNDKNIARELETMIGFINDYGKVVSVKDKKNKKSLLSKFKKIVKIILE